MSLRHRPPGWIAAARSCKRLAALAVAVITALGTVLVLAVTTSAVAQAATAPPYWAQSPFSVPSGTGASLPFTEYEAENANYTGKLIGPDFTQGDLATEASGREAVQLTAHGQYVQFTLTSAANAFDLHYALPQGASGTLSVYVNGTKLSKRALAHLGLQLHLHREHHRQQDPQVLRRRADDVRPDVPARHHGAPRGGLGRHGAPVHDRRGGLLQRAGRRHPAGQLNLGDQRGRRPDRRRRLDQAFRNAISAANSAGESVWIPSGTYLVTSALQVNSATIVGAGELVLADQDQRVHQQHRRPSPARST